MTDRPLLLDSITDVGDDAAGAVVASGSHGGMYPAAVASRAGVRAVLFNDAGRGFQEAGVAGVISLAAHGMAAAAVDCFSCPIGSAAKALGEGVISAVNTVAADLGISAGMAAEEAASLMRAAPPPATMAAAVAETRQETTLASGKKILLLDSASLVRDEDAGRIVITGSHGALIGGRPERALKARAMAAVFNDAGRGIDDIGISRLPALDQRGVAAVTVSHDTARIGDAASAFETGMISALNETAGHSGAEIGMKLKDWLNGL